VRRLADRQGRAVVELPGGHEVVTQVGDAVPGSELTLGVRPEHLVTAARGPLAAQVEMVEFLGERTLAHVRLVDGTRAIATVAGVSPAVGESVQLSLAMEEAHLFDGKGRAHHATPHAEAAAPQGTPA
jgi:multiple sugar transport system ATP-binding protein